MSSLTAVFLQRDVYVYVAIGKKARGGQVKKLVVALGELE